MTVIWEASPVGLEIEFYTDVNELLRNSPFVWYVTCGFRSPKESDRLFAIYKKGGPKAAPGGKSPHNIGEAIDVVPDGSPKPGLQMDWDIDHPAWQWLFDQVKRHPRLHSGVGFGDAPHIESLKFARNKGWDAAKGSYFIPLQNLHYLQEIPHSTV